MADHHRLEIHLHHHHAEQNRIICDTTVSSESPGGAVATASDGQAVFDLVALRLAQLDPVAYGQHLTNALFADVAIRDIFIGAEAKAHTTGQPLHIRLHVTGPDDTPLHGLRWETLRHPGTKEWLLMDQNKPFSRYLASGSPYAIQLSPLHEWRALVAVANPHSEDLAPVDVDNEWQRAQAALKTFDVTSLLSDPTTPGIVTLANLVSRLETDQFHILYLVAHGAMRGGQPYLFLEKPDGTTDRVPGAAFVSQLRSLLAGHHPHLIVLAACESAGSGHTADDGVLSALGPRLMAAGIPAVVAMQDRVAMATIAAFMPPFFERLLANHGQLGLAMAAARRHISEAHEAWKPVLFTRLEYGRLSAAPEIISGVVLDQLPASARTVQQTNHVFISYSRQNIAFAERLARDLDDAGFDVWLDVRQIKGGEQWREAIFTGINQAEIVVACLSPAAVESEWVRREILMARGQGKLVIPVMVENAFDLMRQYDETEQLLDLQIIDFEGRYERALVQLFHAMPNQAVAFIREIAGRAVEDIDPATIPNPFKGLEAFQQTDARIFFGREDLTARLVEKLREERRFLAVVGASGSGKSSLVRAGLIPAIREGELPGSESWPLVIFTPGAAPTKEMAKRLMPVLGEKLLPNLLETLEKGPDSLHLLTEGLLADAPAEARLVLVVDQFEEVFTRASQSEAARFLDLLHRGVTYPGGQTLVILTLRADFFDRLSAYPALATLFEQENMVIATEMTPDNLRLSIEGPAEVVGLVYDHGLPDRILEDVREQPGSLPLLQYALKELYERRDGRRLTFEAYEQIGGVRRALAQHAEDTFEAMDTTQREILRRVLLRLVEVSETGEATRRRVQRDDLTFRDIPDAAVRAVIDHLTAQETRLLIASREIATDEASQTEPTVWIEVSHEALIREWERFTAWIAANGESLRYGGTLFKAANDWEREGGHRDYLLYGARVDRALLWLENADANELQRRYIEASKTERQRRSAQRQVIRNAVLFIAAAITLVMALLAFWAVTKSRDARDSEAIAIREARDRATQQSIAQENEAKAIEAFERAEKIFADLWISFAQQALNDHDPLLALPLALRAASITHPSARAQHTLADVASAPGLTKIFSGHTSSVYSVAFSPDGRTVLSGGCAVKEDWWCVQGEMILWDVASGQVLQTFHGHRGDVLTVAFSPDGRTVLSGGCGMLEGNECVQGEMILWDATSGQALQTFTGHQMAVLTAAFSPDGLTLLSGSCGANCISGDILLWNVASGQPLRTFGGLWPNGHQGAVTDLVFAPDGQTALSSGCLGRGVEGDCSGGLILWEVSTGQLIQMLDGFDSVPTSIALSPDGRSVASAGCLRLADRSTCAEWGLSLWGAAVSTRDFWPEPWSYGGYNSEIRDVAFSPDGQTVLSAHCASYENNVCVQSEMILTDPINGWEPRGFKGHHGEVLDMAFSPDGQTVISGSTDQLLMLWGVGNQAALQTFVRERFDSDVAYALDGQTALAWSADQRVSLRNVTSDEVLTTFSGVIPDSSTEIIAPDGQTVLSRPYDGIGVVLSDATTGQALRLFSRDMEGVTRMAFSPDGQTILTGSWARTLVLWDVASGQPLQTFTGHQDFVSSFAFAPDGRTALSGSCGEFDGAFRWVCVQGEIILWNVNPSSPTFGQDLKHFSGHLGAVNDVAFSPDGQTFLSGGCAKVSTNPEYCLQGEMILWDLASGQPLQTFLGHRKAVTTVRFATDGQTALSGDEDYTYILWKLESLDSLMEWATQHRAVRELTCQERQAYSFDPGCDENGAFPSRTPYQTWTPFPTSTATPTLDLTQITATPTRTITPTLATWTPTGPPTITVTPSATNTPTPTYTPSPTWTPAGAGRATLGENPGSIAVRGGGSWTYAGRAGEVLTVRVTAGWDSAIVLYGPSGMRLADADSIHGGYFSEISDLVLPTDGLYRIEVRSFNNWAGGPYTLTVEERQPAKPTARSSPARTPMLTPTPRP